MEGSEEYFDESEHVDGLAEEEVDETRENEREGCRSSEGSDFEGENEGEGYCGPEGSDFAAEESYEEGDPDAEEGYEEYEEDDPDAEEGYEGVWDEVQEACQRWSMKSLTTPPRLIAQGLKRRVPLQRHHPKRQCGLRMCFCSTTPSYLFNGSLEAFLYHVYNSVLVRRIFNGSLEGLR